MPMHEEEPRPEDHLPRIEIQGESFDGLIPIKPESDTTPKKGPYDSAGFIGKDYHLPLIDNNYLNRNEETCGDP